MPLSLEARAGLLMEAIREDRAEIRQIRDRIYTVLSSIALGSFAITSFLLGAKTPGARWLVGTTDVGLVVLLWLLHSRLRRDINVGHRMLEAREDLFKVLDQVPDPFTPFPTVDMTTRARITETHLDVVAACVALLILAKAAVVALAAGALAP